MQNRVPGLKHKLDDLGGRCVHGRLELQRPLAHRTTNDFHLKAILAINFRLLDKSGQDGRTRRQVRRRDGHGPAQYASHAARFVARLFDDATMSLRQSGRSLIDDGFKLVGLIFGQHREVFKFRVVLAHDEPLKERHGLGPGPLLGFFAKDCKGFRVECTFKNNFRDDPFERGRRAPQGNASIEEGILAFLRLVRKARVLIRRDKIGHTCFFAGEVHGLDDGSLGVLGHVAQAVDEARSDGDRLSDHDPFRRAREAVLFAKRGAFFKDIERLFKGCPL